MPVSRKNSKSMDSNLLFWVGGLLFFVIALTAIIVFRPDRTEGFDNNMIVKASKLNTKDVVYMDDVYIIKGSSKDVVVTESKVLLKGTVKKLQPGMIILGEEAPGFMREITRVSKGKNETIYTTVKVEIERVFSKLDVDMTIDSSKMVFETVNKDGTISFDIPDNKEGFNFSRNTDYTVNIDDLDTGDINLLSRNIVPGVFDEGNTDLKGGAKLRVRGDVMIKPSVNFQASMNWGNIDKMLVGVQFTAELNIKPTFTSTLGFNKNYKKRVWPSSNFFRPRLHIPLFVGVWISINPIVNVTLNALLNGGFEINPTVTIRTKEPTKITYTITDTNEDGDVGVNFKNGGWERIVTVGNIRTPDGSVTASIDVGMEAGLDFLLWGFVGPYTRINPYYKISSTYTELGSGTVRKGPGLKIKAGGRFRSRNIDRVVYNEWWT